MHMLRSDKKILVPLTLLILLAFSFAVPVLNASSYHPPYSIGYVKPQNYKSGVADGSLKYNIDLVSGAIRGKVDWSSFGCGSAVMRIDEAVGITTGISSTKVDDALVIREKLNLSASLSALKKSMEKIHWLYLKSKDTKYLNLLKDLSMIEKSLKEFTKKEINISLLKIGTFTVTKSAVMRISVTFRLNGMLVASTYYPASGAAYAHSSIKVYVYIVSSDSSFNVKSTKTISDISASLPMDYKEDRVNNEVSTVSVTLSLEPGTYAVYGGVIIQSDGWCGGFANAFGVVNFYDSYGYSNSGVFVDPIVINEVS